MFKNRERMTRRVSMVVLMAIIISTILGAFSFVASADGGEKTITMVHVNDVHGRVKEDDYEGAIGFARLRTKLDQLKEENPNVLLLNAGDTVHGTTEINISEGRSMIDLMNQVGFDLMVPGNHDFNFGYDRLIELKDKADFPMITANVAKEDGTRDFDGTKIIEVDGLKLGFFGITTEETIFKTHPDNVKGIDFEDPIKAAKKSVKELEDADVDMVVALVHLGNEGTTLTKASDLLKAVDGIDLMIDGHSHEELNEKVGDTLHVQAGEYTKNIGIVNITFKDGKVKEMKAELYPYEEAKDLEPNKEIEAAIEKIEKENEPVLAEVVGKSKVKLDGEREDVRTKETNLGNLVADAMLHNRDADIGFTNGGGIRASIEKGDITVGDIITTVPFTNTLAIVEATGAEIMEALERGVDSYPEAAGHFPHVSGMKYSFNPKEEVGSRIVEVTIAGKALDPAETYKVVTNDFIAAGGDGYTMFEGKEFIGEDGLLSDVLREYLGEVKTIEPKVEGRILVTDAKPEGEVETDPKAIKVAVNGKAMAIPAEFGRVFIEEGRTIVPLRVVSENLGHEVEWEAKTRTITIDGKIKLTVGERKVLVDGKEVEMDAEAAIVDGRTHVPLRFVSEALGYKVEWNKDTRTVEITTEVEELAPAA